MRRTVSIGFAAALVLAGCGGDDGGDKVSGPPPAAPASMTLTSPAFRDNGTIPKRFTCSGAGDSPALSWRGVPSGAQSLALLVEDPDAPGGTFVHWTAWDIPPRTRSLPVNAQPRAQGDNSAGKEGWTPPCPPGGKPHHYVFTIYALAAPLEVDSGASPEEARRAMSRRVIAEGRITGTFGR